MMADRFVVSEDNKQVAKHAAAAFGGAARVSRFHHDMEPLSVDIVQCADAPVRGVTSFSTVGLSDFAMKREDGSEFATRLELAGACASNAEKFPNVLASLAFRVIQTRDLVYPGLALDGFVKEYFPETSVPHVFLTSPFLWETSLVNLKCADKNVSWLLVVPISSGEMDFLAKKGDDALENLFEDKQIDIFDLSRKSVA